MAKPEIPQTEIDALLKAFPKGVIAFDLETTGLSPLIDKIVEVAALKVTPDGVETFQTLVNPEIVIPPHVSDIHGISDAMVENAPKITEVLKKWGDFTSDLPILAHNAQFDCGFLVFLHHQLKIPLGTNASYCSIKLSRQTFRDDEVESHKLKVLSKMLEIPLENHHRALDDTIASIRIFAKCLLRGTPQGKSFLFRLNDFDQKKLIELPEHLKPLINKAKFQQVLDIKYKGGSHRGKFRPIRPISLLPMPKGNILYAHCLLTDIYKSFALTKIQEVKELNAREIQERLFNLSQKTGN